eukprot:96933-Amphidinium_carterae.1
MISVATVLVTKSHDSDESEVGEAISLELEASTAHGIQLGCGGCVRRTCSKGPAKLAAVIGLTLSVVTALHKKMSSLVFESSLCQHR